jgi:predicted Ser/Thr protein kinase
MKEMLSGIECAECLRRFIVTGDKDGESLPLEIGSTFQGMRILEFVARGGMGVVYKARQLDLDRVVALKVLTPELAMDPDFARRFNGEARALARLSHPNIVQVFDFARESDLYYLTMEFVEGRSLREVLREKSPEAKEIVRMISSACDALEYAHAQGVVHRDIKPENVLVDAEGRVKVADFGLAKLTQSDAASGVITRTGAILGTPRYMAPEQFETPSGVDHRCDVYALGVVLHEMLAGRVDSRFDRIVHKALEQSPDRRYQRVLEFKSDLNGIPRAMDLRRSIWPLVTLLTVLLGIGGIAWKVRVPEPERVRSWRWATRLPGSTVQGEDLKLNPGGDKMSEAFPVDCVLGKQFRLHFKFRYLLDPGNEPWFFLTMAASSDSGHDRNAIVVFPEAGHTIHFGSLVPGKGWRLRNWQTLPEDAHGPGRWFDVDVSWADVTKRLTVRIDGKEVFNDRLGEKDTLHGVCSFALGGTVKDWRIRDVWFLNES